MNTHKIALSPTPDLRDKICIFTAEGTVLFANGSLFDTKEEIQPGDNLLQSLQNSDANQLKQAIQEANVYQQYEFEVEKSRDAHPVYISHSLSKYQYQDKTVYNLISSDRTFHKNMQLELSSMKTCLDNSSDLIFMFRTDDYRFFYTNDQVASKLGYSQQELEKLNIKDISIDGSKEFSQNMQSLLADGSRPSIYTCSIRHKDNSPFPAEVSLMKLAIDSNEVVAIVKDISDRVRADQDRVILEKQLQQAQKMEAVGQLTGGIAHDFNNILASVMGYTSLAIELNEELQNKKMSAYLEEVFQAGERARDLVGQMLAFSRGGNSEPVKLDIAAHTKQAVKMLHSILPSSVKLNYHHAEGLPEVRLDPVQLHQVVMNLCINARDAMQGQGSLDVRLESKKQFYGLCSACHESFTGDYVAIVVEDTGEGMPKDILNRVFEPFFTTKKVGRGSGMGLSMVHGIVHEHGGHLIVDSEPGQGTRFRLMFPEFAMATRLNQQQGKQQGHEHILVVDDEATVAGFLRELFSSRNFKVTVETNSNQALTEFRQDPGAFDLVVTDQTMPSLTGAELAQEILSIKPDVPIILCTGYSEAIDEKKAISLGIKRYLTKPIDPNNLLSIVNDLLSGHSP